MVQSTNQFLQCDTDKGKAYTLLLKMTQIYVIKFRPSHAL